jgi:tetratricopeptide (TPR) repeat protein
MVRSPRYIVATVLAALAMLGGATALLGSVHERLQRSRITAHLQRAEALAAAHDLAGAISQYHAALALERENDAARRGLALTLLSLQRWAEAESYIRDLLREEPTDGVLNRALARIQAARGQEEEARRAYQRAIYGQWPAAPADQRLATRFELVEYLRRVAGREEVVAELVTLKAELPPGRIAAARRVAGLLAESGETAAAIDVLNASLATAPRDSELLVHLAALQAGSGRMLEARGTLRRAVALAPQRADIAERLAIIDHVLALDPTLPRLRLATRANRARVLLAHVLEHTRACRENDDTEMARDRAEAERRRRRRAPGTAETADQEIALAARLWKAAPACHGVTAEARALAQVLEGIESSAEPPS